MGRIRTMISGRWVAVKRLLLRIRREGERLGPFERPSLEYVETHLVDHCNMNCRGCSHFSPVAEPWFADVDGFGRDMALLSRLFRSIRTIRLMGGEPLLHPNVAAFLACARRAFPKSRIHLVTNGVPLEKMPDGFWEVCRENRIALAMTVYPPMSARAERCARLAREQGVPLTMTRSDRFSIWLNRKGDSPLEKTFAQCRRTLYCPVLRDGRLYTCATAAYSDLFNKHFGSVLPPACGLDLAAEGLTGKDALAWLSKPVALCRFCAVEKGSVIWCNGRAEAGDWFVDATSPSK